jgi:exopolyphosphatase/pppGpp-phosphohydrolase
VSIKWFNLWVGDQFIQNSLITIQYNKRFSSQFILGCSVNGHSPRHKATIAGLLYTLTFSTRFPFHLESMRSLLGLSRLLSVELRQKQCVRYVAQRRWQSKTTEVVRRAVNQIYFERIEKLTFQKETEICRSNKRNRSYHYSCRENKKF